MLIRTDEPLSGWTTLRLGGPASRFLEVTTRAELYDAVRTADAGREPMLVLGGGSNLVVPDAGFDGTVVHVATRGVAVSVIQPSVVAVTVEAGEEWEPLVSRAVEEGWQGIEALSGIPGSTGATPIQNVGAYGQEVADVTHTVQVYDRVDRVERVLDNAECGFGYRTSRFKGDPGRFVVGAVTFRLAAGGAGSPIRYAELARRLGVELGDAAPLRDVREAVLALRRSKGMVLDDVDHDTWSAGSFFTNPFVEPDRLPAGAPSYPGSGTLVKTSAAWLVEQAGFAKGYGNDRVSLSTKHTLALTNRGDGSTADLLSLAREIRDGVEQAFGIRLDPEPSLVNLTL